MICSTIERKPFVPGMRVLMQDQRCVWLGKAAAVIAVGVVTILPTKTAGQQAVTPPPPGGTTQAPATPPSGGPPPNPNAAATAADHRNMMEQLGITALRPGPSGNESAPNHANYDEALANPYPNLPEVLTLKNGKKVTSADVWWKQRRPEIVEEFDREVLGRVPANVPKVTWVVNRTENFTVGGLAVVGKELVGKVDNSTFPDISVDIQMTVVTPAAATTPVRPTSPSTGQSRRPGRPTAGRPRARPRHAHPL